MEKVILAFAGEKTAERIRDIIEGAGVAACQVCHSAAEVKRLVRKERISIIVCGYKLRDETAECMAEDLPTTCSVLILAVQSFLDLMSGDNIFKLAAPAARNDLLASVRMLLQVSNRIEQAARPRRGAEERKLIQDAKAILIDRHGMTEEEAHRFLQKKSMDSGARLTQTAQMVLDGLWDD